MNRYEAKSIPITLTTNGRRVFNAFYHGQPNFMTPYHYDSTRRGRTAVEISHGTGLFSDYMYGVTVLRQRLDGKWRRSPLSRVFSGPREEAKRTARAYARWLAFGTTPRFYYGVDLVKRNMWGRYARLFTGWD